MTQVTLERILTKGESRTLETIDMWVTRTTPALASCVLKAVSTPFPLKEFNHLKRIRQHKDGDEVVLSIILARVDKVTKEVLCNILKEHQLDHLHVETCTVSKWPAITRVQYDTWSPLWPMHWRKSALKLPTHSIEIYPRLMQDLLHFYYQKSKEGFQPLSVGLVSDPDRGTTLTYAMDLRHEHPLQHVAMSLIHEMAQPSSPVYLCTGMTVVLVHEPCVMCSMALLHARVHTVVYALPHPYGGLGSACSVHDEPWLNHRFHVYRYCEFNKVKDVFGEPSEELQY